MTSEILYRSAELATGTGRTVFGIAVPYGVTAQVRDRGGAPYKERIEYGACARSIELRGHKVRLFVMHDRGRLPIGKPVELREETRGLHCAFEIANTTAGNDALELVRSGVIDSF